MVEQNGNGIWQQKIKKLNLIYISLVRDIGENHEQHGYAQTLLGLDDDTINLIMALSPDELNKMAGVKAPLFRLKLSDLRGAMHHCQKDNGDRAARLLTAALLAERNNTKEGDA